MTLQVVCIYSSVRVSFEKSIRKLSRRLSNKFRLSGPAESHEYGLFALDSSLYDTDLRAIGNRTMFSYLKSSFRRLITFKYASISSSEPNDEWNTSKEISNIRRPTENFTGKYVLLAVICCLLSAIGGFAFGHRSQIDRNSLPAWAKSMPRGTLILDLELKLDNLIFLCV